MSDDRLGLYSAVCFIDDSRLKVYTSIENSSLRVLAYWVWGSQYWQSFWILNNTQLFVIMLCLTYYKTLATLVIVLFSSASHATIVLEENGYSNIVVAISEDINQPIDNGLAMIARIKVIFSIS